MSYHNEIMNLATSAQSLLYKEGHRDARHAAAEIALKADAKIEQLTMERDEARELVSQWADECGAEVLRLQLLLLTKGRDFVEKEEKIERLNGLLINVMNTGIRGVPLALHDKIRTELNIKEG